MSNPMSSTADHPFDSILDTSSYEFGRNSNFGPSYQSMTNQSSTSKMNGTTPSSSSSTAAATLPVSNVNDLPRVEVVTNSVNSTNQQTTGGGGVRGDKTPLLQADLLRSLSGAVGRSVMGLESHYGLSTFSGVFCPVALSMLSVLLYLRLGFVVGNAGILIALAILVLAYVIILLTILSLCAVSTNGAIEGGGVYYMISRALGPEFGGSIGVLFFAANIFSCALSLAGLSEAMINNFGPGGYMVAETAETLPPGRWFHFLYSFILSLVTLFVCLVGAGLFAKTSLATLIAVAVTYFSFLLSLMIKNYNMPIAYPRDNPDSRYVDQSTNATVTKEGNYTGVRQSTFQDNLDPKWAKDYTTHQSTDFAVVFGVVFSGVTGLMAGANMSGDLKQPNISIPKGTLQAVLATFIVYCVTALLIAASCTSDLLINDYIVIQNINVWPPFIFIGIFATSLASAMSNLIGASRVLNRVAEDRLFGFLLYPFTKKQCINNPVNSVLLAWFLVVCVLLVGALNKIAQVTSIFFLLSYAGVNLACLALELTSAPNFRPTFKYFTWYTAFTGCIGSVAMMFVVDAALSGVAIILLLLLLIALHYIAPMPASWGSISQALIFHQVRKYLLMLDTRKEHVKFWRPQILLLIANPKSCLPLIDFVNDLKKSGLYVLGHVNSSDPNNVGGMDPIQEDLPYWLGLIDYLKIKAFVELTVASNVRDGAQHLVRLSGLGAMKPNTVVLGFYDSSPAVNTFNKGKLLKNIKFAKLERAEVVEYFTAQDLNPGVGSLVQLSTPGANSSASSLSSMDQPGPSGPRLSAADYVGIIADVLKMNKNVCLARYFYKLDKEAIFKAVSGAGPKYVDVWPVDLVRPQNASTTWDNSSLFLLQLACILSMVDMWKSKITLRVYLCVTSLQDMQRKEAQLKEMLGQLRIFAKSILLPWDHVICHLTQQDAQAQDITSLPAPYLHSFNDLLQRNSGQAAVVFLNMPLPPNDVTKYEQYLQCLETITNHLPPILLVHGISSVISTAL